ncbi:5405_t:CDS:1, partial [Cetraspora pellucida]
YEFNYFRFILILPFLGFISISESRYVPRDISTNPSTIQQIGEACVFNRILSSYLLGHVAFGFQIGNDQYIYGADEGPTHNDPTHLCGDDKYWWQSTGTRAEMLKQFKDQKYDRYKCEKVTNPNAENAQNMMTKVKAQKYYVNRVVCFAAFNDPTSNCLTDTISVLTEYNAPGLSISSTLQNVPNDWFEKLSNVGGDGGVWEDSTPL